MAGGTGSRGAAPIRWLGVLPFFVFAGLFLIWPTLSIVIGAFRSQADGSVTLQNIRDLNTPAVRDASWVSIKVSVMSALIGCLIGFAMALATIAFGVLMVVPTAYRVRLKMPELRPVIEFITLLPLVIPAIVIVFGYIRLCNTSSWLPLTGTAMDTFNRADMPPPPVGSQAELSVAARDFIVLGA